MTLLKTEASRVSLLRERLLATHDDLDEETLADTLEGLTDLQEMIAATIRSALDDEASVEALKARLDTMKARLERVRGRARSKREACAAAMHEARYDKLAFEDMTVSLRAPSQKVDIADEAAIPGAYWRTPEPVLDRRGLGEALKTGLEVAGARLVEGAPSLTVRVR